MSELNKEIKLLITLSQDGDTINNEYQFLEIFNESTTFGNADGDYFCIKTERWAFDSFDELIEQLNGYKKQYDLLKSNNLKDKPNITNDV